MDKRKTGTEARAPRLFQGEWLLVVMGLLGFALAAVCEILVLSKGGTVAPDGDLTKAVSFNAALGIFLISTAAILPLSGAGPRLLRPLRSAYCLMTLCAYSAETIQQLRGVDPRFPQSGQALDNVVGALFGLDALLLIVLYLLIGVHFFRRTRFPERKELVLSARYAMIAVVLSFAAGVWISIHTSRFIGAHGNMMWLHGLGFHALQVLPFIAWLTERSGIAPDNRRGYVHSAGLTYLIGLVLIGWQTVIGKSVLEWTPVPVLAAGCFLISLIITTAALRSAWSRRFRGGGANTVQSRA